MGSPSDRPILPPSSGGKSPVAIVTGANHGIGAGTARTLANRGVRVLVTGLPLPPDESGDLPTAYYTDRSRHPEEVADAIRRDGGQAHAVALDLADGSAASTLYYEAEAAFDDPVRILVHNASGWIADTFGAVDHHAGAGREVSVETFDRQFDVDARAGALLIAEHARRHRRRDDDWGRILTLTSGSPEGFPGEASYGAAKAALENYTMTAAAELARMGITANSVLPPVTDTGWVTDSIRHFVADSWSHHHVAAPGEVAAVIDWLCSDAAYLVTGNRIVLR